MSQGKFPGLQAETDICSRADPRPFVLQTTFPSRELPDSETIEQAKLQNAVVVQRFT